MKNYIKNLLLEYFKFFKDEKLRLKKLHKQLENKENIWTRKNFNWHLTACIYFK